MNYPPLHSICTEATDVVVSVLSAALKKLEQPTNSELALNIAETRSALKPDPLTSKEVDPVNVVRSSVEFIVDAIENIWRIQPESLQYHINYLKYGCDGIMQYYYFEVIFSRPLRNYPIPQTTASVFITITVSLIHGSEKRPKVRYRLEGHHQELDVKQVILQEDWLFTIMRSKRWLFKFVEDMDVF